MADRVTFDTSFLIDFQRERRDPDGVTPAHDYMRTNPAILPVISATALGEFAEGFESRTHPLINWVRETHEVLPIDDDVALVYGATARNLLARGQMMGSNDLWIAVTALCHGLPIVTADTKSFRRVPGLDVRLYRSARPRA